MRHAVRREARRDGITVEAKSSFVLSNQSRYNEGLKQKMGIKALLNKGQVYVPGEWEFGSKTS